MLEKRKVAVIGSGASAVGALTGLFKQASDVEITLFDVGQRVAAPPEIENPSQEWIADFYDDIYRKIRAIQPYKFPPPKTHFGEAIAKQPVGDRWRVFRSETFGGLTNYWGATLLPFTDREMAKWPINKEALQPYYEAIAQLVGLTGGSDALNDYYSDFSTRPSIKPTAMLGELDRVVNRSDLKRSAPFKILSGLNRCAIETRKDHPRGCVYCGECLAGCFRDSIYSARHTMSQYKRDARCVKVIEGRVRRIEEGGRRIHIDTAQGSITESDFAKVFLCAGCLASTEIMMTSLGISRGPVVTDNAVYVFPILYLGKLPREAANEAYLALCNLIFACIPQSQAKHSAQVLIYPNFDYLWRYNMPTKLWAMSKTIFGALRSRLFWGRLYIHSDQSQAYAMEMKRNQMSLEVARKMTDRTHVNEWMKGIRAVVNQNGFYIPPIPPIQEATNSHYGGTLPYGGELVKVPASSEVMPGVYLCDGACFPESPAMVPTFTLMANAMRVATEAMRV